MSGSADRWLLLYGTPLTAAVWDGVAACLRQSGAVWCPSITPAGDGCDAQGALAARLAAELPRPGGRLHVVGHVCASRCSPISQDPAVTQVTDG